MNDRQSRRFTRFSGYASNDNRPRVDILKILSLASIWICVITGLILWFQALLPVDAVSSNFVEEEVTRHDQ